MSAKAEALPDEKVVTFRKPIDFAGTTYTSMTLREPTADELIKIDGLGDRESDAVLLSLVSGVPDPVIRKLGARDFLEGVKFLVPFLR